MATIMTAEILFNKLGYSRKLDDDYVLYIKEINDCMIEIAFDFNTKQIEFYCHSVDDMEYRYDLTLDLKEVEAINLQIKELGW